MATTLPMASIYPNQGLSMPRSPSPCLVFFVLLEAQHVANELNTMNIPPRKHLDPFTVQGYAL